MSKRILSSCHLVIEHLCHEGPNRETIPGGQPSSVNVKLIIRPGSAPTHYRDCLISCTIGRLLRSIQVPVSRRQIVKIALAHLRTTAAVAMLGMIVPILAGCGGGPETPANPTAALPTAAVVVTQPATNGPTAEQSPSTAAPVEPRAG